MQPCTPAKQVPSPLHSTPWKWHNTEKTKQKKIQDIHVYNKVKMYNNVTNSESPKKKKKKIILNKSVLGN